MGPGVKWTWLYLPHLVCPFSLPQWLAGQLGNLKNTAINVGLQIIPLLLLLQSILGSYSNFHFNSPGTSILHSHQKCIKVFNFSTIFPALIFSFFRLVVFPMVVEWCLIVVFICISLMICVGEHLFVFVGHLYIFLEKCLS